MSLSAKTSDSEAVRLRDELGPRARDDEAFKRAQAPRFVPKPGGKNLFGNVAMYVPNLSVGARRPPEDAK